MDYKLEEARQSKLVNNSILGAESGCLVALIRLYHVSQDMTNMIDHSDKSRELSNRAWLQEHA